MEQFTTIGRYRADHGLHVEDSVIALDLQARLRHVAVFGATGVGKSTLLINILARDLEQGHGVLLLDPHGDLARSAIDLVPQHRINHVAYLNLPDRDFPLALNVLEDPGEADRARVVDASLSAMRTIWQASWGPRMEHVLRNAMMALIEVPGSTLLLLPRLLTDAAYRERLLQAVSNPFVLRFFTNEFEPLDERMRSEVISPILNKIGGFVAAPEVRNVLGQRSSTLHIAHAMAHGRVVIANLAKGEIGASAAHLMGAFLIGQAQAAAMARSAVPAERRRPFHIIVDEAQNFATDAMISLLSEARKTGISLTLATQYTSAMPESIRAAILGNVGTLICYRVGAADADVLGAELDVLPEELIDLAPHSAWVRAHGYSGTHHAHMFSAPAARHSSASVVTQSRRHFARARALVDRGIRKDMGL